MIAILLKSLRESWLVTTLCGLGFAAVATLLNLIIPDLQGQLLDLFANVPFIRLLISSLMGIQIDENTTARVFLSIIWTHPVVLALLATHQIIHCTRFPAAEIDRATIDVTLALPVSRTAAYVAESIAALTTGALVIALGLAGALIGATAVPPDTRLDPHTLALILLNLIALYAAAGALALLASALSSRRGRAIGIVFAILLASFLWTFLAPFWKPADATSFLSVLDYYRPAQIVMTGTLPPRDPLILAAIAAIAWTTGLVIFNRRDIATT